MQTAGCLVMFAGNMLLQNVLDSAVSILNWLRMRLMIEEEFGHYTEL
jgi:hypothetical protein